VPELPEIEILKQEIERDVVGRRVTDVLTPGDVFPSDEIVSWLKGTTITQVRRRGKRLVIDFDTDWSLIIHLMMVGQLLLSPPFGGEPNAVCLILRFSDDSQLSLGQVHPKYLHPVPTDEVDERPEIKRLGIDPLDKRFPLDALQGMLSKRRGAIKPFLLDQTHIAGIGNTYTDEILFQARLHPKRGASGLSAEETARLYDSIVETLHRGIALGGSSEMAFLHLDGREGSFQEHFQVKRRKGKPCFICGTPIEKMIVGGRGTYFCPKCQAM